MKSWQWARLKPVALVIAFGCEHDRQVESPELTVSVNAAALEGVPADTPPSALPAPSKGEDRDDTPPTKVDLAESPERPAEGDAGNAAGEGDEDAILQANPDWEEEGDEPDLGAADGEERIDDSWL